jgi:hypothetical protein
MNLRRILRSSRTLAVQCRICRQWHKPRHVRVPAMVCRTCETTTAFQCWKPTTVTPATPEPQPITGGAR